MSGIARIALLVLAMAAAPAAALGPGDVAPDFRLADHTGAWHTLHALADRKAVVLMTTGNGCPIARQTLPALAALRDSYEARGVAFLLLDSNLPDTPDAVRQEAAEFRIPFPILLDADQQVGKRLGVVRTAEVFVIRPPEWRIAYRGPLDDRLSYGQQKPGATHFWLRDALDAVLAGRPAEPAGAESAGCLVHFPKPREATPPR